MSNRKVFLSFLGTNNYKECIYSSKEKGKSNVVKYVQDAILDLYCDDFSPNDIAYIFLTEGAEEKNWKELKEKLEEKKGLKFCGIKDVPEGYSEEQIWTIFDMVYNTLQENDEIILDVTHGFRSLPMLQIVLLNYAKSLKNISVNAILYGAFEALGPAFNIDERIPNPADRNAPLLDLTTFSAIQAWTFGAESFIKTGRSQTITDLSMENILPILIHSKGTDATAADIRTIMNGINQIENIISTNRGKLIEKGRNVKTVREAVERLSSNNEDVFSPIKPILGQIKQKLKDFGQMPDWEASVKWCIDNNLIQQGITQLQEGIISYLCDMFNLSKNKVDDRDLISQALNIYDQSRDESDWLEPARLNKEKVKEILQFDFVTQHNSNYSKLTEIRNDINHGGFKLGSLQNPNQFKKKLQSIFDEFQRIKGGHVSNSNNTTMLLNLSNHPSDNWPDKQIQTAMELYGTIIDMPFPNIPPQWSREEVVQLADEFVFKIEQSGANVVHIMGELVFTHLLINKLSDIGISCIASTTERIVEMDGDVKKIKFNFVRFRDY